MKRCDNDSESYHSKAKDSLAVALTKQFIFLYYEILNVLLFRNSASSAVKDIYSECECSYPIFKDRDLNILYVVSSKQHMIVR